MGWRSMFPEMAGKQPQEYWAIMAARVADGDIEDVLTAASAYLRAYADRETHATVKALLESASEHCSIAAFEYYASTK